MLGLVTGINQGGLPYCIVLLLCVGGVAVHGRCTPDSLKDDLHLCLQQQGIATFYQFPVSVNSSEYSALCGNATCMSYCFEVAVQACSNETHVTSLGDGKTMKAAYVGFCEIMANATNALACGVNVVHQTALNLIGTYQSDLQAQATNADQSGNTVTMCSVNNMEVPFAVYKGEDEMDFLVKKCETCCPGDCFSYHCPLCPADTFKPTVKSRVLSHLHSTHWRTRVQSQNGLNSVMCKLAHNELCAGEAHFHCASCNKTIKRKKNVVHHLSKCHSKDPPLPSQTESDHVYSKHTSDGEKAPETTRKNVQERLACSVCSKLVKRNWMKFHLKTHNKTVEINVNRHHHSAVIDAKEGVFTTFIYMSGRSAPIHVIKKTTGINKNSFCEHLPCIDVKTTAQRGGNNSYECDHVKSTSYAVSGNVVNLEDSSLHKLLLTNFITKDRYDQMLSLKASAEASSAPFVVEVPHAPFSSQRYIHISLYTGTNRYWCKTGRTILTVDTRDQRVFCRCSNSRRYCLHKAVAKWYIFQEMPHHFHSLESIDNSDDDAEMNHASDDEPSDNLLPVNSEIGSNDQLMCMLNYSMSKKIPSNLQSHSDGIYQQPEFLLKREISPLETSCHICQGPLNSVVTSRRSTIIFMNKIIPDVTVFVKRCVRCNVQYNYQEWKEGIHNFNNSLLLGHDVCLYLRSGLQNHVALGRSLNVLVDMLDVRININNVSRAYRHFEALTDHSYKFSCILCGFHPAILIWDTFRKAGFRYAVSDLTVNEQECPEQVDAELFWLKVEKSIIAEGICSELANTLKIEPSFEFWGPWIGKKTRLDDMVYNTEFKKCSSPSSDTTCISEPVPEELLLHLLSDEKTSNIRKLCKELGLLSTGSTNDMIVRMREKSITKTGFDKAYEKVFGHTGGWAIACCRHGTVYAAKNLLRSESPRDYIDLERSLKHRPTISVCDIAHLNARHANIINPDFYQPNDGRLCESSEANIASAKSDQLHLTKEFLSNPSDSFDSNDQNSNPVTGVTEHYSLFDWFHQYNCKKEEEVLRRCSLLTDFAGIVDTQCVEQLFSSNKRDIYFLNNLTPANHLFVFRLITHLRNEKRNKNILKQHSAKLGKPVTLNDFGQLMPMFCDTNDVSEDNYVTVEDVDSTQIIEDIIEDNDMLLTEAVVLENVNQQIEPAQVLQTSGETSVEDDVICSESVEVPSLDNGESSSLGNLSLPGEEYSFLLNIIQVTIAESRNLQVDEMKNVTKNCKYAQDIIFGQTKHSVQQQVEMRNTEFGSHHYQGISNYCGLCCLNNALQAFKCQSLLSICDLDRIADKIWIEMVSNPCIGLTATLEPMRDIGGFYSIEVLQAAAKTCGYEIVPIDARTISGLSPVEVSQYVLKVLSDVCGKMVLIVRLTRHQHWVTITENNKDLLLYDSQSLNVRLLTHDELGNFLLTNCVGEGCIFFMVPDHPFEVQKDTQSAERPPEAVSVTLCQDEQMMSEGTITKESKAEMKSTYFLRTQPRQMMKIPPELLHIIFKEVILSDGDVGYKKLSLVCSSFRDECARAAFQADCHLSWLRSLRPQSFWMLEENQKYYKPFAISRCASCGDLFKEEGPGFWGGNGRRGEYMGFYEDLSNPGYCCVFCARERDFDDGYL